MQSSSFQCDAARLRLLLDDRLSEREQAELSAHVESCEPCRNTLEKLAADAELWSDVQSLRQTNASNDGNTAAFGDEEHVFFSSLKDDHLRCDFLAPSDDPTKIGRLGDYEIERAIGRGGMGVVFKAHDSALNRAVAVKVLAPQWAHSEIARRRFAREARAAAAVSHRNVITIFAVNATDAIPYLVMPFIDGRSLQDRIATEKKLQLKSVLRIGAQIAEGLAAAHSQGLVHRDVKPANILLENGHERVVITDFGLARAADDASLTRSCFIAGTPEYMAPEQAEGTAVDHRTDLFCLGSVLFAMCAGQPPFRRESTMGVLRAICESAPPKIRELNPTVPLWLEKIIARLLEKEPAKRYQSAEEVASLLNNWLVHFENPAKNPRPEEPAEERVTFAFFKRSAKKLVAVAILVAALAITITAMPRSPTTAPATPPPQNKSAQLADEESIGSSIRDIEERINRLKRDINEDFPQTTSP